MNTLLKRRPQLLTWPSFPLHDPQRQGLEKVEKATDATLIRFNGRPRARAMANRDQSFNKLWSVGSAVSTATSLLSAAVDGLGGRDGIRMDLTQAVREDRPIGKAGIGGVDTKERGGLQMTGGDRRHRAPLHHCQNLHDLRPRQLQCLILHQLQQRLQQLRLLDRRRRSSDLSNLLECF